MTATQADAFVLKLDSAGNFVWAGAMGGGSTDFARTVAVDSSANVYIAGVFQGTADFDPGDDVFNLTPAGSLVDSFVVKLDSAGDFVWARAMGGGESHQAFGVAVDSSANVYVAGDFRGTADFDPGDDVFNLTPAAGFLDAYALKLDSDGNFVWARAMGGMGTTIAFGVAADSSANVYVAGFFAGTADFDPGDGVFNLTSVGMGDAFVLELGPERRSDLELSKSATPSVVTQGDRITYTLRVDNNGPSTAKNVVVTDDIPAQTSVVSLSAGCASVRGEVTCGVEELAAFDSVSFTIRVQVESNATTDLTNRASVTSATLDSDLSNNSDRVKTELDGRTELSLSQFVAPNPLVVGQPATKQLAVSAIGPGAATGVVVTDPLPTGLALVSAPEGCDFASGEVTCNVPVLLVGQTQTFEIEVLVNASVTGSITNTFTAMANELSAPVMNSRTVPVVVNGVPIPTPFEKGVVDTADFIPFGEPGHAVAPKSIVSIFGTGFTAEGTFSAARIPLPTMLGGVMVSFDGIKAPLFLVAPNLIIAQLPMGMSLPTVTMVIDNGIVSEPQEIQVAEYSPGIFTLSQDGQGQAIVVHAGTAHLAAPVGTVGNSRPAGEGDFLTIYANGLWACGSADRRRVQLVCRRTAFVHRMGRMWCCTTRLRKPSLGLGAWRYRRRMCCSRDRRLLRWA